MEKLPDSIRLYLEGKEKVDKAFNLFFKKSK